MAAVCGRWRAADFGRLRALAVCALAEEEGRGPEAEEAGLLPRPEPAPCVSCRSPSSEAAFPPLSCSDTDKVAMAVVKQREKKWEKGRRDDRSKSDWEEERRGGSEREAKRKRREK